MDVLGLEMSKAVKDEHMSGYKFRTDPMGLWFVSDTHFGHEKIIQYCKRPFASVAAHDDAIIRNWNARVRPGDTVWHLGDFGFGKPAGMAAILSQLNGHKRLILGNHDQPIKGAAAEPWEWIGNYAELLVKEGDGQKVILAHYPFEFWNRSHRGSWHFHGHCHGSVAAGTKARVDVGVDGHPPHIPAAYGPVAYADISANLSRRNLQPQYHHGADAME